MKPRLSCFRFVPTAPAYCLPGLLKLGKIRNRSY